MTQQSKGKLAETAAKETGKLDPLTTNLRYYERHADEYIKNTESLDMRELHSAFIKYLPKHAYILDAGCGSGRDSVIFLSEGFQVTAIDASAAMVKAAISRKVPAIQMAFQEVSFVEKFDGIWACASLLHVPRMEIEQVLRRLYRALKVSGIIFITLKEGTGEGNSPEGRFFANYSLEEIKEYLSSVGFWQIVFAKHTPDSKGKLWINILARRLDSKAS